MKQNLVIVLAALVIVAPLTTAHEPPGPVISCEPTASSHDVGLIGLATVKHTDTIDSPNGGFSTVSDGNLADCNGDGAPNDHDCENEYGVGGVRFTNYDLGSYATEPETGLTISTCDGTGHHGSRTASFTSSFGSVIVQAGTDGASSVDPALDCDGVIWPASNSNDWLSDAELAAPTATLETAPAWGCDGSVWLFVATGIGADIGGSGLGIGHASMAS